MTAAEWAAYNQANTDRLGWGWSPIRSTAAYVPAVAGKWWTSGGSPEIRQRRGRVADHVGRIMETELGERREGNGRCTACQANGEECWFYSTKGSQQIAKPGDACACCRWAARKCSGSKRQPAQKKRPRSRLPPPRPLQPYWPGGGPPPGAGGDGIMA